MVSITMGVCRHALFVQSARGGKKRTQRKPRTTYKLPNQRITVDTKGAVISQALGGFKHATKFVDQQKKWKSIFLVKEKPLTVDSLELYNQTFVIPTGHLFVRVKSDKDTEFTDTGFRKYCLDVGVQLEVAVTNTP